MPSVYSTKEGESAKNLAFWRLRCTSTMQNIFEIELRPPMIVMQYKFYYTENVERMD